jgi:hypothetical protein
LLGKKVKCPACGEAFTTAFEEPVAVEAVADVEPVPPEEEPFEDDEPGPRERPRRRRRRRLDLEPHRGTLVLVLGILSLFILPIILGPIAWVMGSGDLRKMRAGLMDREGESNTNARRICGIIGTVLGVLCCIPYSLFFVFGGIRAAIPH